MCMTIFIKILDQLIGIVDLTYRCNSKTSQMRLDQKRLRVIVRNTSDSKISIHSVNVFFKFGTER